VLDTKGDMIGALPADGDPFFVVPHDRRSIGLGHSDRLQHQAGRPRTRRPLHSAELRSDVVGGGAEIFVACIVHLQATRNKDWGWADLQRVVTADIEQLATFARDHNPNALKLLGQSDSKTTMSILTTFQTHMRIVWPRPGPIRSPVASRSAPGCTIRHPIAR
jgi:hypothetical protein